MKITVIYIAIIIVGDIIYIIFIIYLTIVDIIINIIYFFDFKFKFIVGIFNSCEEIFFIIRFEINIKFFFY